MPPRSPATSLLYSLTALAGVALLMSTLTSACGGTESGGIGAGAGGASGLCEGDAGLVRPEWWTKLSHCHGEAASYGAVFDASVVHPIAITVSASDHQATLADLDAKYTGGSTIGDLDELPKPIWVPVTVKYRDLTWTQVAMRWKGHASLRGAWQKGVRKLSFKLDFDHFEDQYPELLNQRFYGFNRIIFSNGYNDPSLLRDKTAGEIFRAAGIAAPLTAFAPVTLDWGEGPVYLGLYTMIEDPPDHMLKAQLGSGKGTLYKPKSKPARWLSVDEVGQSEVERCFVKKTNTDSPDWSDVLSALDAVHSDRSDPAAWRARMEAVFDVSSFLRTLAVNQVIVNWDAYGCMNHNYLLYANPKNENRLTWLPWDLNESLQLKAAVGCPAPGSVLLEEVVSGPADGSAGVDTNWPLIRLLLADPQYRVAYATILAELLTGAFAAEEVIARIRVDHALIAPYVVGPTTTEKYPYTNTTKTGFSTSLTGGTNSLEDHIRQRHLDVAVALASL